MNERPDTPSVSANYLKLFSDKLKKLNNHQNICDNNFLLKD